MAALRGATIPGEVYAWIIVFVLPVNSAINPIIYTFAAHNPLRVSAVINSHFFQEHGIQNSTSLGHLNLNN